MSTNDWTKNRLEGKMVITECTFCGAQLFRGRIFQVLESPEGSGLKLGATFQKHMTECHYDQIAADLAREWLAK